MEKRIDVDGIDDLKPGEGIKIDEETKYEFGADLDADKAPIIDHGTGKIVAIRTFEFKMNPNLQKEVVDKQTLFNAHAKQIATLLWADGLVPLESVGPRVIIDKVKGMYQIFVPCEAKTGTVYADTPKNLSEELLKSHKNKDNKA